MKISAPPVQETRTGYNQPSTYGEDGGYRQAFNANQEGYTSAFASRRDANMGQETTAQQGVLYQTSGDDIDNFAYREHMKQVADKAKQQEVQEGEREPTTAPSMREDTGFSPRGSGRRRSEEMKRQTGEREETSGRRRRQSGNYEARREREDYRSQQDDYGRQQDEYRRESEGTRDYRQDERENGTSAHGHKTRRRRQSGDVEGQREREDSRGSREEYRRHRRHSKKRGSLEGEEFPDVRLSYLSYSAYESYMKIV